MSVQEKKAFIRRYVKEVYNQQDLTVLSDFIDDRLPDSAPEHLQQFFTAFPDSHTEILDLFGEDDKVIARLRITGTNAGSFAGQPPTGKKIQFDSFRIYQIADNKIVATWAMQDRMGLMEQLGLIRAAGEVNWGANEERE